MRNIFLIFGLPGSGKGTQVQILVERFGIKHISCGDLFRQHLRNNTDFGKRARMYIEQGELTPDSETIAMFLAHLAQKDFAETLILEGFPRTLFQSEALENFVRTNHGCIRRAILLQAELEELVKRISGRRICPVCGKIYNVYYNPPLISNVCNVDGLSLECRTDDRKQLVHHRLSTYIAAERPVWNYFRTKSLLVTINATQPIEVVASNLWKVISSDLT